MKTVVLLHGLRTNSMVMKYMANNMRAAGNEVHLFNYDSSKYSDSTLESLHSLLKTLKSQSIYLIGHSMGGLVIRNYIHKYPKDISQIKGVITIATPHNQSICAHTMTKSLFRKVLGTSGDSGLTKQIQEWESEIPIGCIAGFSKSKMSANFFIIFNSKKDASDGTVYVDEAILSNCTDKIILKGSHTGLLFKKDVANQCLYFLENKEFKHLVQ